MIGTKYCPPSGRCRRGSRPPSSSVTTRIFPTGISLNLWTAQLEPRSHWSPEDLRAYASPTRERTDPMIEEQLRRRLEERVGEYSVSHEIPPQVFRRARRRIARNAVAVLATIGLLATG